MRFSPLLVTLSMLAVSPAVHAKTELEQLRERCAAQQQELDKLKGVTPKTASAKVTPPKNDAANSATAAGSGKYVVKAGDSFERIARKAGVSKSSLIKANGLKPDAIIHPGQTLKLPSQAVAAVPASKKPQVAGVTKPTVGQPAAKDSIKPSAGPEVAVADKPVVKSRPAATKSTTISSPAPKSKESAASTKALETAKGTAAETLPPTEAGLQCAPNSWSSGSAAAQTPPPTETGPPTEKTIQPVTIESEMTYGEFAAKHGTDAARLNSLNGLDLSTATVLAKGSELYVPAQP